MRIAVNALVVFVAAAGCVSLGKGGGGPSTAGFLNDAGHPRIPVDAATTSAADGGLVSNPLCGVGFCFHKVPDDPGACLPTFDAGADRDAGAIISGKDGGRFHADAGDAAIVEAGATADASSVDAGRGSEHDAAPDGGSLASAGHGEVEDASSQDGATAASADAGVTLASCQVRSDDYGKPVHQCLPSGHAGKGEACASSAECRPGLACVGTLGAGKCYPYCCDPKTRCQADEFCAEQSLLEPGQPPAVLKVPVCAPAELCELNEPYPCDRTKRECRCPEGKACFVVPTGGGVTACFPPGASRIGEPCPCAAGYFCSQATSTCVKVCSTDAADTSCNPGKCQATVGFPAGFGLCVGPAPAVE